MGKLYAVGFGPGGYEHMTIKAADTIRNADVVTGYTTYIDMIRDYFPDKEYLATPMTKEIDRCRMAVDLAAEGKTVAMVSSGDSGIISDTTDAVAAFKNTRKEGKVKIDKTVVSNKPADMEILAQRLVGLNKFTLNLTERLVQRNLDCTYIGRRKNHLLGVAKITHLQVSCKRISEIVEI